MCGESDDFTEVGIKSSNGMTRRSIALANDHLLCVFAPTEHNWWQRQRQRHRRGFLPLFSGQPRRVDAANCGTGSICGLFLAL